MFIYVPRLDELHEVMLEVRSHTGTSYFLIQKEDSVSTGLDKRDAVVWAKEGFQEIHLPHFYHGFRWISSDKCQPFNEESESVNHLFVKLLMTE